jgi:hypothetical protein
MRPAIVIRPSIADHVHGTADVLVTFDLSVVYLTTDAMPSRRLAMIEWTGADAMWIMVAGRYRTGGVDAAKRTENLLVPNAT